MPILGMQVSDEVVNKSRLVLARRVEESSVIKQVVGQHTLILSRKPYSGTFTLRGWSRSTGFFPIARFGMLPMPGCFGVVIFHHVEVEQVYRHMGLGTELLKIRQEAAKELGYGLAMATTDATNKPEASLLFKQGWVQKQWFKNPKTTHDIFVWSKEL